MKPPRIELFVRESPMTRKPFGWVAMVVAAALSPALESAAWSKPKSKPTHRLKLRLKRSSGLVRNAGAQLGRPVVAHTDQPLPTQSLLALPPSFIVFHSDRVRHDLLLFHAHATGTDPTLAGDRSDAPYGFVASPRSEDPLAELRMRDRLLLMEPPQHTGSAGGSGVALFSAATIAAAHAPAPLRLIFDGPVRLGPAIFSDGGLGMGIGGSAP